MTPSWPTFRDLMSAYRQCRINKPASRTQVRFEQRLGKNISLLLEEIQSGNYHPAPAKCFVVLHPKPREIFAAHFRDRIVHHALVSRLEPIWEKKFIESSFACRKSKGTHGAIRYAQKQVRRLSQGGNSPIWALQLDIAKFFVTINRYVLCQLLLQHCHHPKQRQMIEKIYTHDARIDAVRNGTPSSFSFIPEGKSWFDQPPENGIAIGNLTSQFGANVYLNALDHFILRQLKPSSYLRYMDDLLFFDQVPDRLLAIVNPIDEWLKTHRTQRLNPAKTTLAKLSKGISYLGYKLRQVDSAVEPLQVYSEPIKRWKWIKDLRQLERSQLTRDSKSHFLAPFSPDSKTLSQLSSINSRLGYFQHCRSFQLRRKSLDRAILKTTIPKDVPMEFSDPWCPFKLKKGYRALRLR